MSAELDAQLRAHLLRHLHPGMSDQNNATDGELVIQEVRFEGVAPHTALVVVLTGSERPGCRFGLRVALWNKWGGLRGGDTPEQAGNQILNDFDEIIATEEAFATSPCAPDTITWIEGTYWDNMW